MNPETKQALSEHLIALGDDELILGHRNSEWCGHAPILEEDIAFANLALDEIGHAGLWYTLAAELLGENQERYPDQLVYFREAEQFRNLQMLELPRGDWAFSILRQYLFDSLEKIRLAKLLESSYQPIADIASKIGKEEIYHYRHSHAWVKRLGLGTEESSQRMQEALDQLWPCSLQAFTELPEEQELVKSALIPHPKELQQDWDALVLPTLSESGLSVPDLIPSISSRLEHTTHLKVLLAEMQFLARSEPEAEW